MAAAVAAGNESELQSAAALQPALTTAAAAADARPVATLDPRLLMAARRGDSKALKDLLQLNDDDGNDDQQGEDTRADDEGSGTPTTDSAASTTTSVEAAPSISPLDHIVDVDPRRPDAVAAHLPPPPPVPVLDEDGVTTEKGSLLVHSEIVEQVVVEPPAPPPHDDVAPPARQPPAAAPAGSFPAAVPVLDEDGVTMEGDSLLHVVAACGDTQEFLDCVDVIVRNKEKKSGAGGKHRALEAPNNKGDTPLHCAARAGNVNMMSCLVDLLIEATADDEAAVKKFLRRKNRCGETALHQAVRAASKAAIDKLLSVDPELAYSSSRAREEDAGAGAACSPFFLAVSLWGEHDEMDIARHLFVKTRRSIRSELSYYCSGPDGRNVLHAAVSRASVKTVVLLSQLLTGAAAASASVEMETPPGLLLLSQLASQRDKENGSTPLHLAASLGGLPSRRYWQTLPLMPSLVLNANVAMAYQPDKTGLYPIHVAAGSGSLLVVEMLLKRCPDCATLRDAKGRTLLHVAAEKGCYYVVRYVCRQSQKQRQSRRARPGSAAAEAARLAGLLSSILNAQDMNGDTPLHRAVHAAQLLVVQRLIGNQQVRLDVPNNVGMRPIDVSWTTLPLPAYYAWDPRLRVRMLLLLSGAPYGENNRGDLFRKKCVLSNQDEEKKMSENLTAAAQVLALFSVLITTVTFASAFTLPGGSRSAGDGTGGGVAGTPVLGGPRRSYAFDAFILADALAFGFSLWATSLLLGAGVPAGSLQGRFRLINLAYGLMWHSGRSLLAAFGLGLFVVLLPVARSIAIAVAVLMIALAAQILKESKGFSLGNIIPMIGIGRSRQVSPRDLVLGSILFVFRKFWPYVLIFGFPAIRRWPRFTLSPY
ncbi:protein ACCELERATED CELL DEATH 6-like [Miscanthus floridulus]|uniref:protein ACCELERATED CELL DEATH 6-like n=1 Tax=Miscanthus floridulus TaxID=154761 RepID=UPI0034577D5B